MLPESIRNILLGISLAAPLGPAGVAIIQNGLRRGFLRAFLTGVGVTLADATYLLIAYFGLSRLISSPAVQALIRAGGALVLLYLGVQSLREAGRGLSLEKGAAPADRNPLVVGYLVNVSNPIAVVWWLGIFGSLLGTAPGGQPPLGVLLESSAILVGILLWHSATSLLTHWGKRFLNATTARYVAAIAGIALVAFGVRFAWAAIAGLVGMGG